MFYFIFSALVTFTTSRPRGSNSLERGTVEQLYRRYGFQVERRCLRILSNPAEAADAAQEVFVRLMTKGGDFRREAEWMTWLYKVTTNICLNKMRNKRRRGRDWQDRLAQAMPQDSVPSAEAFVADANAIRNVLERFDEDTRAIVIYHYFDEMSQEEIGSIMGVSRVTVNKKLGRFKSEVAGMLTGEMST